MTIIIYATIISLAWVVLINLPTLEAWLVGFIIGIPLVILLRPEPIRLRWGRLPLQAIALFAYVFALFRDIVLSGVYVARIVLSPQMSLKAGILAVSTQDTTHNELIVALSANYITLTPGELVVAVEDNHVMYVHCLDIDLSTASVDAAQTKRLNLLQQILGNSS